MSPTTKVWNGSAWVELGGGSYTPTLEAIVAEMFWPFPPYYVFVPGTSGAQPTLDASGEHVGWVFQIPRDGVITDIGFRVGTLTTNPSVVDVRLETVATTGFPSGTLIATGANGSASITAGNAWKEAALTTPLTVAQGDWVAVVVTWTSGNVNIVRSSNNGLDAYQGGVYAVQNIGGSAAKNSIGPFPVALKYQDTGIYSQIPGTCSWGGTISTNYNSSSTPDERGIKMTMPFSCRANGMWFSKGTGTGARTLKLYDSANTVLWSHAFDSDFMNATLPRVYLGFTDPIDLDRDSIYRLTCEATDGTNIQVNELSLSGLQSLYSIPGGIHVEYTSRSNGGSWTDNAGASIAMGLLITGVYQ